MEDCVFCQIVAGRLPAKKVYEDDDILGFYDINPSAPVHILIIPKKHISMLSQVDESDMTLLGKAQLAIKKIAHDIGIEDAFKVQILNGEKAGQEVFHLHYHLKGGWSDERGEK